MTDIEESRLSQLIRQKIVESYQDIRQMVGTEHIYVFAIGYSHFHGVGSFMCAANTIENLTDSLLQEPDDISPELVWSVVEWPYNSAPPSNELNELVNNLMADCEGNINESAEYLLLNEQIERCLIQSLLEFKKGSFFFSLDLNKLSPILFVSRD
ncbi:hypothetical protein V757_02530 [Pelistega indica]|uniref:DUF4303 domain-containing protein n=1 Tax=Pelistega indica TaxID=1414851 RepID=V8G8H6_9BURK|nr:DUF4303 domain-containing protein [Pelistega indica]ETD72720.1 hypothetical protein V757_02530 [Pelistega indica]